MTTVPTSDEVLADVASMITILLGDYDLDDVEITMATTFHDDLELESVDLVTLADMLAERYGRHVNLAEFFAEKDIDDVIAMSVGEVVDYVVQCQAGQAGPSSPVSPSSPAGVAVPVSGGAGGAGI